MDRVYEGDETRQLALALGCEPVVVPLRTRVEPWEYDREMYKRRNEIERLFRRLKGFRRIFARFEKLDVVFLGFIVFALIVEALNSANTPWESAPQKSWRRIVDAGRLRMRPPGTDEQNCFGIAAASALAMQGHDG